jgi:hypothetical protein
MATHDGVLPTVEECLDARNPDKELTEEFVDIYNWLWFECFPATAHRSYWGRNSFYEVTPSACMPGNTRHRAYVSIASEAYFYLQLENNHTRWTRYHKDKIIDGKEVTAAVMRKEERFKARYSQPFIGQEKFRGFSDEGLHRFEELKQMVKLNRAKDLKKVMLTRADGSSYERLIFDREQQFLAMLTKDNPDKVGSSKTKSRKRKAQAPVEVKKRICSREEEGAFNPGEIYERMIQQTEQDGSSTDTEH